MTNFLEYDIIQKNEFNLKIKLKNNNQPILISIELLPGANTIIFKYKHLLSGRSGIYTLNNPAKKPISTTVLKSAVAMQGGQSVPIGDTFSIYSFFMSKRIR